MADGRPEWLHVADLARLHRDRNSDITARLVESRKGFGVEIRKLQKSHHREEYNAAGPGIVVPVERLAELITALQRGHDAATALRQAARA